MQPRMKECLNLKNKSSLNKKFSLFLKIKQYVKYDKATNKFFFYEV